MAGDLIIAHVQLPETSQRLARRRVVGGVDSPRQYAIQIIAADVKEGQLAELADGCGQASSEFVEGQEQIIQIGELAQTVGEVALEAASFEAQICQASDVENPWWYGWADIVVREVEACKRGEVE